MAAVKSKGNKTTEIKFVKLLRENKITGWRRHVKKFGSPDFIFPQLKIVVFIDGCFWHGCKHHCIMPKSRIDYWDNKIERNKKRDKDVNKYYRKLGWRVIRLWEHRLAKISGKYFKSLVYRLPKY